MHELNGFLLDGGHPAEDIFLLEEFARLAAFDDMLLGQLLVDAYLAVWTFVSIVLLLPFQDLLVFSLDFGEDLGALLTVLVVPLVQRLRQHTITNRTLHEHSVLYR